MNTSHTFDQLMSLIAEGTKRFSYEEDMNLCQKCHLSKTRKKVCVDSKISKINEKNFFILSEFPEKEDEENEKTEALYAEKSSSGILENLVGKLGIKEESYFTFALKCVPHEDFSLQNLNTCIFNNLMKELRKVKPKFLLCFGIKAFLALTIFDGALLSSYHLHLFEKDKKPLFFQFENQNIEIYLFPSAQELKQYPKWRVSVWSKLTHFKKNNVDS